MPKKAKLSDVKARIKENTAIMRDAKKLVTQYMTGALKAPESAGLDDDKDARAELAAFIKASRRVAQDNTKLAKLTSTDTGE